MISWCRQHRVKRVLRQPLCRCARRLISFLVPSNGRFRPSFFVHSCATRVRPPLREAASSRTTLAPAASRSRAAARPLNPAPTTSTSVRHRVARTTCGHTAHTPAPATVRKNSRRVQGTFPSSRNQAMMGKTASARLRRLPHTPQPEPGRLDLSRRVQNQAHNSSSSGGGVLFSLRLSLFSCNCAARRSVLASGAL